MRVLIQRVRSASLVVDGKEKGSIEKGLVVYIAFNFADGERSRGETEKLFHKVADKLIGLRIFPDEYGKMNLSVVDIKGGIVFVSNFTLFADISRGKRPSFSQALSPEKALVLYLDIEKIMKMKTENLGIPLIHGTFGADMYIKSVAWGPVNIIWDV